MKYMAMVLHAHLPYVRHEESRQALEERWLFEAYSETYLPLLAIWERLERKGTPFAFALTVSPTLLTLLCDREMSSRYVRHLKKTVELARRELVRTVHEPEVQRLARMYYARYVELLDRFERYGRNIVPQLVGLADRGHLEILTCSATHGFLPALGNRNSQQAQIRVAVETHRRLTGRTPRGIWLAECGYVPGIESVLEEQGLQYFLVDSHAFDPVADSSVYAPLRVGSSQVYALARDPEAARQVWSSFVGYPGDPDYREYYRDIGFDLDFETVKDFVHPDGIRVNTGIKYHRITGAGDQKELYRPEIAEQRCQEHAAHFVASRRQKLDEITHFLGNNGQPPLIVAPYDAELFGHWWFEGPQWLEQVALQSAAAGVEMTTPGRYLDLYPEAKSAEMSMTSWGRGGYAEVWVNPANDWIYPHLHRIEERLIDLVRRKQRDGMDDLTAQALRQMAREVLLAESSDWAFIMTMGTTVEYAVRRTEEHLHQAALLAEAIETGSIDEAVLRALEAASPIFPDLNLDVFLDGWDVENTARRRVLMLAWEFPPRTVGGLARAVYDLSRALAQEGAEVHVVTCHGDETLEREVVEGVCVHRVTAPVHEDGGDFALWATVLNVRLAAMANRVLSAYGPFDVIHAHDWLVADSALMLSEMSGCPLVSTIHATEYGRHHGLHNDLQRKIAGIEQELAQRSREVIVCSEYMRAEMRFIYQVPPEKLRVLPNGVDLAEVTRGTQQALGLPRQRRGKDAGATVFYVGRLVREKGVQVLLDSAPAVLRVFPDTVFQIAGKGPMLEALQRQAAELGIGHAVQFLGFVDDERRNQLIEQADAAVFPSLYEPFGIVALEAMGIGTPTVVSQTGGLAEIVEHEVDGWLVEPGDSAQLAATLLQILSDPERAREASARGREKTITRYGWGSIARGTMQVYEDVITEHQNGRPEVAEREEKPVTL